LRRAGTAYLPPALGAAFITGGCRQRRANNSTGRRDPDDASWTVRSANKAGDDTCVPSAHYRLAAADAGRLLSFTLFRLPPLLQRVTTFHRSAITRAGRRTWRRCRCLPASSLYIP